MILEIFIIIFGFLFFIIMGGGSPDQGLGEFLMGIFVTLIFFIPCYLCIREAIIQNRIKNQYYIERTKYYKR